jgi:phospholipid/cholesterol/gamma-HCH transport system substrate-binding protein
VNKRPPSIGEIAIMVVFALSCFGLLTYIWKSFGGPSPLAPQGYRVVIDFDEATQLSDTADVRISGISVGRVKKSELGTDRTRVEIEIEERYAPIPRDTRAIVRQKTLLGESYVELTPGNRTGPKLFDGERLRRGQVQQTTELDEVTRALDLETRRQLQRFVKAVQAIDGEGDDLNAALGQLPGFTTDSTTLLRTLDRQHRAVRQLVRDGGAVFDALGRRQGELSGLVRAADAVLTTTARRDRDLAETVRILPTTLRELRPTLEQVKELSIEARPLVRDLRPGARALSPALRDATVLAPQAEALFGDVDRLVSVSREGVPAATRIVRAAHPLFKLLPPTLREAQPIVDYLGIYKEDLVAQLASFSAALNATAPAQSTGEELHYLRALVPFLPEGLAVYDQRIGSNRHNAYGKPGWLRDLPKGLESFSCTHAGNPGPPDQGAPPCVVQKQVTFQGRSAAFTQVRRVR